MEKNTVEFFAALEVLAEKEKRFIVKEEKYDGVKYNSPELCNIRDALTYYDIPIEELKNYQDEGDGITAYDGDGFISWKENINDAMNELAEYCDARDSDADSADDIADAKFNRLSREELDYLADICENDCLYQRDKYEITNEDIANVTITDQILSEARLKIKQDVSRVKILASRVGQQSELAQDLENAVKDNDIQKVEELFLQGANINNAYGQETLKSADSSEMIKLLVKNGARIENGNDANYDDDYRSHSFLIDAIYEVRADKVAAYLQCGADVNFDESSYYGCEEQRVDLALKSIVENKDKKTVDIITKMIEDARKGKPREEIRLEDYVAGYQDDKSLDVEGRLEAVRHKLAGDRMLKVVDNFDANNPLDTAVKTTNGKTAYGFIPKDIADKTDGNPAPVIVTEELFDHLDVKGTRIQTVQQRGFNDMRDAVEYALQKPDAIALGGGDGSFNIFFKKEGFEKGLMYANLMYSGEPTPSYIVRSISPTGKVKGDLLFEGDSAPSMSIPSGFDDKAFEEKIKSSAGDRVSGKTWNQGNVMKALRMHAQEGKYPSAEEFAEIKQWIADGKTAYLTSGSVGMYIKQALEQKNSAMFFKAGQEADVWGKVAPAIKYVTSQQFLETMERADNASVDIKSAIILAGMAVAAPEDKRTAEVKKCSVAFNLGGKDLAVALVQSEKGLLEFDLSNAEKAYKTVESIVGNKFENMQMLDDVLKVCKFKHPDFEIGQVGKYCHLVADAVKTARAGIDIKSMSPEEKKAYFSNKAAFDIIAVQKAFTTQLAKDNSKGPRE